MIAKCLKSILKSSHSNYLQSRSNVPVWFAFSLKSNYFLTFSVVFSPFKQNYTA